MNDRIIGYSILTLISLLILIPLAIVGIKSFSPVELRAIEFENVNSISFLNKQDPVRMHGVQVGVIHSIDINNDKALVRIKSSIPLKIYQNYSITAYLKGLMGDRYIAIDQGNTEKQIIAITSILHGNFLEGPTDVVAYAWRLKKVVHTILNLTVGLKDGSKEKEPIEKTFRSFVFALDTISTQLATKSEYIQTFINGNSDTMVHLLNTAINLTDTLALQIPSILTDLEKMITTVEQFAKKIDTVITQADLVVSRIENPELFIWKNDIILLQKDLKSLRELVVEIRLNGLKLPVRAW